MYVLSKNKINTLVLIVLFNLVFTYTLFSQLTVPYQFSSIGVLSSTAVSSTPIALNYNSGCIYVTAGYPLIIYNKDFVLNFSCPVNSSQLPVLPLFPQITGTPIDISTYPNPATHFVTIRSQLNSNIFSNGKYLLRIMTIDGGAFYFKTINGLDLMTGIRVEISRMPKGTYYVAVEGENSLGSCKIIKQ